MAEAVQGIRDFWKENGTLNTLVLEQMGEQHRRTLPTAGPCPYTPRTGS